jgi:hypothetical protein
VVAGGSCTFIPIFTPSTLGLRTGTITLVSNDPASPTVVQVSGTGTKPQALVSATSGSLPLNFGIQMLNTTSGTQSLTLQNIGTGPLTLTSVSVTGNFGLNTNNCPISPSSLSPSSSCTLLINFTPTVAGTRNGQVTFNDNDPLSPQTAALTGIGQQNGVPPTGIIFQQGVIGAH